MATFTLPSLILCYFMFINCNGFEFSMERKNISLKGKSYCGMLRCQVDTVTEDDVTSLIKMDIYYLNNRTLMSTMLSNNSEIQDYTENTVNITGSMSKQHGELRLYFSQTADCLEANFICRINFFHTNGQSNFSEKTPVPISRENVVPDLHMKSQISVEQTISDQSGLFLKNLIWPKDILKDRLAFSFLTGNSDSDTLNKRTELPLNNLLASDTKQEFDINQTQSSLESRIVSMFNIAMTELFNNIKNIFEQEKNMNRTVIDMKFIEDSVQRSNESRFLQRDVKLIDMMNKIEGYISKKELTQGHDANVNMSQIERSLDSISQKLDDLWTNQLTRVEILANISGPPASFKLQEKQLRCERGMRSSPCPREVMSITYNNTNILCDTETDGGGWIIIQRRIKGDTSFNVSWDSYKKGFGSLQGDFWLGNDVISNLTRTEEYSLRIDMRCGQINLFTAYNDFLIENETMQYMLRLGKNSAIVRDEFSYNNYQPFTTFDRDNDKWFGNCATHDFHNSGWWHNDCSTSNLNGVWGGTNFLSNDHVYWTRFEPCSFVEMKIRKKRKTSCQVNPF